MKLENVFYILGIAYVIGMAIWSATWVGTLRCTESYTVPWHMPLGVVIMFGIPFLFGRWSK